MSHLLARIMLALLMLPLAGLVYLVTGVVIAEVGTRRDTTIFFIASIVTTVFIVGYWVLLWRSTVRWTSRRVIFTAVAMVVAVALGLAAGALGGMSSDDFGIFVGGVTVMLVWLTLTVFVFRESRVERVERLRSGGVETVVCAACGYNMTGLQQTICPECGAKYTLNELLACQPQREQESMGEDAPDEVMTTVSVGDLP